MSVVSPNTKQIPVEITGGLVTFIDPENLPPGASPDCQDVDFLPGLPGTTKTRDGLVSVHQFSGNPTVNYERTFIDLQQNVRNLYFDSAQRLWQENPQGTFTQVFANTATPSPAAYQSTYVKSDTAFGREFMAFSDGQFGTDMPMQFDGATLNRVSQVGPGESPNVVENSFALSALSRASNVISGTTTAPHGLSVGSLVTIAGVVNDPTFNGVWPVESVSSSTDFTAWGAPGQFAISSIIRSSNVVTATLSSTPESSSGDTIIVGQIDDSSFDGEFVIVSISGNTVTWAQTAADADSAGGIFYIQSVTLAVLGCFTPINNDSIYEVVFYLQEGQTNPFYVGSLITIASSSDVSWNGTFTVLSLNPRGTPATGTFAVQINQTGNPGVGSGGTASLTVADSSPTVTGIAGPFGNISAGLHKVSVIFVTSTGYFTAPAPPKFFNATGGFQAKASAVATSPQTAVVARILLLTPSGSSNFFYNQSGGDDILPMRLNGPSVNNILVDFSDSALVASTSADLLFNRVELGECLGCIAYGARTIWWGERNKIQNLVNPSFDGGQVNTQPDFPAGWTLDVGTPTTNIGLGQRAVWGASLLLNGDGTTALPAQISQSAYLDYFSVPIIEANVAYSVRVRLALTSTPAPTQGDVHIHLSSASLSIDQGLDVPFASLTTSFKEFIGTLTSGISVPPIDLRLTVYIDGTPSAAGLFIIDNIEVFPTLTPYILGNLRVSNASDPEAFDDVTGRIGLQEAQSEPVICCAVIRERLYIHTDSGWFATQDNGNEPGAENGWVVTAISTTVGSASVNSCGAKQGEAGTEWYVCVSPRGLYIFWGDSPEKISQEIEISNGVSPFSWDAVNWTYAHTAWVVVDDTKRRILVGLPLGEATVPNVILFMDYKTLGTAEGIAATPEVHMSAYSNKQVTLSGSRKYCPWSIAAMSGGMIRRSDGTDHLFIGNSAGNGKVYDLTEGQTTDDGTNILAYYLTSYYPSDEQKTGLQMLGGIVLLTYVRPHIEGSGTLSLTAYGPGNIFSQAVPPSGNGPTLSMPMQWDLELFSNFFADRIALKIAATGPDGSGPTFSAQKMDLYLRPNPAAAIRGFN